MLPDELLANLAFVGKHQALVIHEIVQPQPDRMACKTNVQKQRFELSCVCLSADWNSVRRSVANLGDDAGKLQARKRLESSFDFTPGSICE